MRSEPDNFRGSFLTSADALLPYGRSSGPLAISPTAVALPHDVEDVVSLLRWSTDTGHAVIPRGAGTGMPGGNVGAGTSLDFTGWAEIEAFDPDERTAWVQPGVTGRALDSTARERGLFFPPLPSSADRCTLGGMIANNAAGARSFGYGAVREWIAELDVVWPDGSTERLGADTTLSGSLGLVHEAESTAVESSLDAWPKLRKNSSGYAVDRFLPERSGLQLLIGSEGTLGLVIGARVRLAPVPQDVALIAIALPDPAHILEVTTVAEEMGAAACEFFGRRFIEIARLGEHPGVGAVAADAEAIVLVEVVGSPDRVEEGVAQLTGLSRSGYDVAVARSEPERRALWSVRHAASPVIAAMAGDGYVSTQVIEDSVVPPDRLPDYLDGLESILANLGVDAVTFGHAGDGNAHVNPLFDVREAGWRGSVRTLLEETVELVASLGGTLSGEHGDGRLRAPFLERIWARPLADSFRRIKAALDPTGVLNPGVVVPTPGQDPLNGLTSERIA